jgi:HNH endonuclease
MPRGENNRKLDSAQVDEIVRVYTTPLPDGTWKGAPEVAREFGVSAPTVKRWLQLRGVHLRSSSEALSGGKRCKPVKNLPEGAAPLPGRVAFPVHLDLPGAPQCKCGCGNSVTWNRLKNRWSAYVIGHYRQAASYKDGAWLRAEYVVKRRTLSEIAAECGVTRSSVRKAMRAAGIEPRDSSAARSGRQVGEKNPAWKGAVAQWAYSSDWKVLARQIRNRDQWTCQDCGEQRVRWGKALHVHHIDGDKTNNDPLNLIALCDRCHRGRHRRGRLGPVEATPAA